MDGTVSRVFPEVVKRQTKCDVAWLCFFAGIKSLMSEMFAILEQVLQMTESLAADLRHNNTQAYALIAGTTKSALKQLVIGKQDWQWKRAREFCIIEALYTVFFQCLIVTS